MQLNRCPACDSPKFATHYEKGDFKVVRCLNCTLVFNNPQIFRRPIEDIYHEDYFKSSNPALGYEDYVGNKEDFKRSFRRRFREIKRHISAGKVLDIGCAAGFFLEIAEENGFQGYGIDCSRWATEYALRQFPGRIVTGYLDQSNAFEGQQFDLITAWDLMEQLPDPKALFSRVPNLLKADGIVALTIRDIDSPISKALGDKWIHFRPQEKYIYFNSTSIDKFLRSFGLQVFYQTTQNTGRDCTVDVLLSKLSHVNSSVGKGMRNLAKRLGMDQSHLYLNLDDIALLKLFE